MSVQNHSQLAHIPLPNSGVKVNEVPLDESYVSLIGSDIMPLQSLIGNISVTSGTTISEVPRFAKQNNIAKLNWLRSSTNRLLGTDQQQRTNIEKHESTLLGDGFKKLRTGSGHQLTYRQQLQTSNPKSPGMGSKNSKYITTTIQDGSLDTESYQQYNESDYVANNSQLLFDDLKPYIGIINQNDDDEMQVSGYRSSCGRTLLCWLCIVLTGGLLRLILHWWKHWYLIATHKPCSLQEAEKVLIQEDYKGKHTLFHVKTVENLNTSSIRQNMRSSTKKKMKNTVVTQTMSSSTNCDDINMHLSVHFSGAKFKACKSVRIFHCKQIIYAWDNQTQSFNKINGLDVNVPCAYFHQQKGLTKQEQLSRRVIYGSNEITVPYKDIKTLLFLEILNPFYVFQIFSVVLWFTYDYYYYACVILLMSIFGISMSIIQTKKNQDVLRETVQNTGSALVVGAKGEVIEIQTHCLVPGDIIEIPPNGCVMQCDAVLLSGNCILDESMLTGESIPVTKTPISMKRDIIFDKKEHARHTLFSGTKVIQTRYIGSKKVLAFVINTGNITAKGALIRSILYPPPVDYKFEQDSYKFIQCLALIALIGFIYTLASKIYRGIDAVKIAVESLDLITIVVPPALPAAMTVGRFYAQKRLKQKNIYCISPRSINVAGSIDCCCFDKTGTLTEDGLDMWGVVPKSPTNQFQIPIKQVERLPYDHFLFGMVTCHSIAVMNGKLIGDPLDLKMFESTGWILEDSKNIPDNEKYSLIYPTILRQPKPVNSTEISTNVQRQSSVDDLLANIGLSHGRTNSDHGIVREFPFTSNLQRMSVITRCLSSQSFKVYCKGSPEVLKQLCHQRSLPDNYVNQLSLYAKKGYRIIAVAYKPLSQKMNYTKAQRLSREEIECDLEFLGFVVLENRLKPDTSDVIHSLAAAKIRTIMITGDNILTALSVARDSGIVSPTQAVITVHASHASEILYQERLHYELHYTLDLGSKSYTNAINNENGMLSKVNTRNEDFIDCSRDTHSTINGELISLSSCQTTTFPNSSSCPSIKTCETWTNNDVDAEKGGAIRNKTDVDSWRHNYRFAMDGKTWQIVRDHFTEQLPIFLTRGAIYARMSPEQKQALIVELQKLDFCVAMCGDGANDCGALKVAHTGISLSETESSIASPFTSRKPTIASVLNVIKEGRAALVTSFGIFKYMAAYSLVQFVSVMILYSIDSNLTDKQYLYIDLGLISIFAFFFGKTEAYSGSLEAQAPLSSLISLTPLASIIFQLIVVILFQTSGWFYLHQQSWFVPFKLSDEEHLGCFENYTLFAISSFQYIILAFVFSKGAPYRKPIWSNLPFCLALAVNLLIVTYLVIYPTEWIANFFQLIIPPNMNYRYIMVAYGILNFIVHFIVETVIVELLIFKKYQTRKERNPRSSKRKYMQVEYDLLSYQNWPPITEEYETYESAIREVPSPTYINISAEQSVDIPKHNVFPSFFDTNTLKNFDIKNEMAQNL